MDEPTDNVSRLARIAKTMEAGHWPSSAKVVREAANEIELLREQLRLANIDNFNTTAEADKLRAELKEAKARNTMYLSKIQEYEVREI